MRIWSPFETSSDVLMAGFVEISFYSSIVKIPASSVQLNNAICSHLFSSLFGVQRASCQRLEADAFGNGMYEIKFLQWSADAVDCESPHGGNPDLTAFTCDASKASPRSVQCELWDIVAENVKEHVACANHGRCDYSSGVCECDDGWYGDICSENSDDDDVVVYEAGGQFFSGSLLRLKALRSPDKNFAFLKAMASRDDPVFIVRGDGDVSVAGGIEIANNLELKGTAIIEGDANVEQTLRILGDLAVEGSTKVATPFTVSSAFSIGSDGRARFAETLIVGGDVVSAKTLSAAAMEAGAFQADEAGIVADGHVVARAGLTAQSPDSDPSFALNIVGENLIRVGDVAEVRNGSTIIRRGGIHVDGGGLLVRAGGIDVKGGLRVDGGLELRSGALSMREGFHVEGGLEAFVSGSGATTVLKGAASDPHFSGSIIAAKGTLRASSYRLLEGTAGEDIVFAVDGEGALTARSGCFSDKLAVHGAIDLRGSLSFETKRVRAAQKLILNVERSSFIEIEDDGVATGLVEAMLRDPVSESSSSNSQLLVVVNSDAVDPLRLIDEALEDRLVVTVAPGGAAVLAGAKRRWTVAATASAMVDSQNHLDFVELLATRDLDIGPHTFRARDFEISSAESSGIVFIGEKSNLLRTRASDLSITNDGALRVSRLVVTEKVEAPLDLGGHSILRARLEQSDVVNAGIVTSAKFQVVSDEESWITPPTGSARLALFIEGGVIGTASDMYYKDRALRIPRVAFDSFANDRVDFNGAIVENAHLRGGSVKGLDSVGLRELYFEQKERLPSGTLAVFDTQGRLVPAATSASSEKEELLVTYTLQGLLNAPALAVDIIQSDVDWQNHALRNAHFEAGSAAGLEFVTADAVVVTTLSAHDTDSSLRRVVLAGPGGSLESSDHLIVTADGSLNVAGHATAANIDSRGDAYVGGSLVVAGAVVGSGPYVDSSDARKKTNLQHINESEIFDALAALPAYRYELVDAAGEDVHLGFLAQDVEQGPFGGELVKFDAHGDRYVAYARFVPLFAVAVTTLADQNAKLRTDLGRLSATLATIQNPLSSPRL